eukprot:sb/3476105/
MLARRIPLIWQRCQFDIKIGHLPIQLISVSFWHMITHNILFWTIHPRPCLTRLCFGRRGGGLKYNNPDPIMLFGYEATPRATFTRAGKGLLRYQSCSYVLTSSSSLDLRYSFMINHSLFE